MTLRFCFFIYCFFFALSVSAQQTELDKIRAIEAERANANRIALERSLDSAVMLMENEEYLQADRKFKNILKNSKTVSSDLAFHFGKNSYFLKNYKQSIDWLNKYIQLKGTTGQFSKEAVDWLKKSETELMKEKEAQSKLAGSVLSVDYDIDCGPTGKVTCPVCNGTAVVVRKSYLGDKYSTCTYCNKTGFLSCPDYNKLLRGQLKASTAP